MMREKTLQTHEMAIFCFLGDFFSIQDPISIKNHSKTGGITFSEGLEEIKEYTRPKRILARKQSSQNSEMKDLLCKKETAKKLCRSIVIKAMQKSLTET